MVSHAFAALIKKRANLAEKEKGFTLIELLVTVIIIGVLAAIAIPVYLNVQGGAKDSAVKSDLTAAKTFLVAKQTQGADKIPANMGEMPDFNQPSGENYTMSGGAPASADGTTPAVPGNSISYRADVDENLFCFSAKSASGKDFAIDATSAVTEGTCGTDSKVLKSTT